MSDGLSIATQIWWLGMMCILSKERFALCAQVEGKQGDIVTASPIPLQSRCKCVPKQPIPTYVHSCPQCQSILLKLETHRARRNSKNAIGGRCWTPNAVLLPARSNSPLGCLWRLWHCHPAGTEMFGANETGYCPACYGEMWMQKLN